VTKPVLKIDIAFREELDVRPAVALRVSPTLLKFGLGKQDGDPFACQSVNVETVGLNPGEKRFEGRREVHARHQRCAYLLFRMLKLSLPCA